MGAGLLKRGGHLEQQCHPDSIPFSEFDVWQKIAEDFSDFPGCRSTQACGVAIVNCGTFSVNTEAGSLVETELGFHIRATVI